MLCSRTLLSPILYIIVGIYQPKFPDHPSPCPLWQLQVCSLCEPVTTIRQEKGRKKKTHPVKKWAEDLQGIALYTLYLFKRFCEAFRITAWLLLSHGGSKAFEVVSRKPISSYQHHIAKCKVRRNEPLYPIL